jgi:hypothetical protein
MYDKQLNQYMFVAYFLPIFLVFNELYDIIFIYMIKFSEKSFQYMMKFVHAERICCLLVHVGFIEHALSAPFEFLFLSRYSPRLLFHFVLI